MSSSFMPVAYSIACDAPCDLGCVMRLEYLFSPSPACSAIALTATPAVRRTHVGARGTAIGDRAAGAIACREASVVACVVVAALIFSSKALQPP